MALPYNEIPAITDKGIEKMLADGVFTTGTVMARIYSKKKLREGGEKVILPIMSSDDTEAASGGFYDPRDSLSLQDYEGLTASEHDWKYVYGNCVIYKADIAKNGGRFGVLSLIESKLKQTKKQLNQRAIKGIMSDGTASTGALTTKQFVGLDAIIASSGTYGGISSTDLSTWSCYVDDNSGTNRALTQALLDKNYDQAVEAGIGGPTMGVSGKAVFTKIKGILTPQQRTMRESSVDGQGHKGQVLVYNGIDYLIENSGVPSNTLFHVDENHTTLFVHKDHDFRKQSISDLETADAQVDRLFMYACYASSDRRFNSRLNDITE